MKKYRNIAKNLRNLADSIEALVADEQDDVDVEDVIEPSNPDEEKVKVEISFEEVRAVLAELTRDGKQKEVKGLITSYGAKKLSDVPEDKYQELLDKARKI